MVTGPRATGGNPFHFTNWPSSWYELYQRSGFLQVDPLPRYAITSGAPATWTEVISRLPRNDPAHRVYAASAAAGFTEGMVIPLRNALGDLGLVTMGGDRVRLKAEEIEYLKAISSTAFLTCEAMGGAVHDPQIVGGFTVRELDCIALLGQGFTDGEIAKALGISRTTVISHMENARRKVGARSRAHLVSIAMQRSAHLSPR
jgi:DNA-binding CsgD family transcriptional regulator